MRKIFRIILTIAILIAYSSAQSFAIEAKQEAADSYYKSSSRVTSVGFDLSHSMAGFGYNVITDNLFDCVPSYGGVQTWQSGSLRYLRVRPGTTVTIAGSFYYRTFFGNIRLKEFVREVYVPHNTKLVVVK